MPTRVLVVDDSLIFRKVVRDCLAEIPEVEVVGVARDGRAALEKIRTHRPDLVTLDVEMPGMDGLQVLEALQREKLNTTVIMLSSLTERGAATTTRALAIGAFDFIMKPSHQDAAENARELKKHLNRCVEAARRHQRPTTALPNLPRRSAKPVSPKTAGKQASRTDFEVVCIGVSTGGPRALATLLPQITSPFPVPIVVVQHMPRLFTATMAKSLDSQSSLRVIEADDAMPLQAGTIYIAPGGKQLRLADGPSGRQTQVTDDPPVNSCKPSVDYLLQAANRCYGRHMLAIILTGMGNDGLAGCRQVSASGGEIWTQERSECTVYGMPRQVEQAGLADQVLNLQHMAAELNRFAGRRPNRAVTSSHPGSRQPLAPCLSNPNR